MTTPDSPGRDADDDLRQVRARICDMIVTASAILSVPTLGASLWRITTVGWLWPMAVHIAATALIWALFLFRRSLPYTFHAVAIVSVFLTVGLMSFWRYGMFAGANPMLLVAPVLATVLFGKRPGIALFAVILFWMMVTASSFMFGGRVLEIERTTSPTFVPAWITYVMTMVLSVGAAIAAIAMSNHHLASALAKARQTQEDLERQVRQRTHELEQAKSDAERQARTDVLTGMNNRRAFFEYAQVIDGQSRRYEHAYAIAMIDLDHFKAVNDTWGHDVGDAALVAVGALIAKTLRETDIIGRIGGEEFAVVLPETQAREAAALVERLRTAIAEAPIATPKGDIRVTVSIGVAALAGAHEALDQVIAHADAALYRAKSAGRNRIEVHTGGA